MTKILFFWWVGLCFTLLTGSVSATETPVLSDPSQVLNPTDITHYRRIFKAHETGDFATASKIEKLLENKELTGYILYDKYFSKHYRTRGKDITLWFKKYGDLAVAPDMYQLGKQKKAILPAQKPRSIYGTGTSCSYVMREDPINLLSGRTFSKLPAEKRRAAQKTMRQIERYLKAGRTLNARRLIESKQAVALFSASDFQAVQTALAFSYFLDNENDKSLNIIEKITQHTDAVPLAFWTGGLVHWRLGHFQQAADYFAACALHPTTYPLLKASSSFWAARAYLTLGQYAKVGDFLEAAAQHPRTFYGLLALRLLGQDLGHVWDTPPAPDTDDIDADFSHPALTRFYALKQIGQTAWAEKELSQLYLNADLSAKSVLMMISEKNHFDTDLAQISGQLKDDSVRYPAPNWAPQDGWKLDKALVFAFVLQESCFNARAKSSVGALGLMQIMPATGRELARLLNYPWSLSRLSHPAYNLSLGQHYLSRLLKNNDIMQNIMFAAVAYNAGPGNLSKWKNRMLYHDDPLLFLESIPSRETRHFTERILVNYWIYRALMGQDLKSLDTTAAGGWPMYSPH